MILEIVVGRGHTLTVNRIEGIKANIHAKFHKVMSGQLRFLG